MSVVEDLFRRFRQPLGFITLEKWPEDLVVMLESLVIVALLFASLIFSFINHHALQRISKAL